MATGVLTRAGDARAVGGRARRGGALCRVVGEAAVTEPYFSDADLTLYQGDALEVLRDLPDRSVHMACTSPPFWNLRDYQADGQIGLEPTSEGWATSLVRVFAAVRRVLRDDAVLFIEIGDSYDGNKELVDQPGVLKNALRADGWRHRQTIILHKSNAMPESVSDRCTTAHSYVLLMVKSRSYYWDQEALREPAEWARWGDQTSPKYDGHAGGKGDLVTDKREELAAQGGKNARTVWTIPTEPNALAICRVCDAYWQGGAPREHCGKPVVQHFAAFPRELVRRMILAGTSERGVCAECGAPWVRETEVRQALAADGKTCLRCGKNHGATRAGSEHRAAVMVERFVCNETTTLGWQPSCECLASPALMAEAGKELVPVPVPATILDPFSGSGTSLLVARQLGRHAIGVELSVPYCAMTRARLSQLSLLAEGVSS